MEKFRKKISNIYEKFMSMDKKKKAYTIVVAGIVFLLLWAFISAGVITSNFNRANVKNAGEEQKVDAIGIIITETKEGQKYFEIYGETGHYSNDHSIATLHNVIGNFYKDNEVSMSFQSSKGTYDENTKTITLYENTYIALKDEVSLKTDKLIWQGNDKNTVAEGNVVIQKGGEMNSVAEKCIISPNYDKIKLQGKTITKVFSTQNKKG